MSNTSNKHSTWQSVVVVTHEATTGPAHVLRDYLIERAEKLLFIAHPLLFIPSNYKKSSYWQFYKSGRKIKEGQAFHFLFPEFALYIKDMLYSVFWNFTRIGKTDIFFGVNNLNAFVGLMLKKIGLTKMVIFYCIDYVPDRFFSPFVNSIYHTIDKWAVEGSDYTWNLSPRMSDTRKKKWGKVVGNQITVPIGVWYERIQKNKSLVQNPYELIYVGTILEKQGLDMCIEAVKALKDTVRDIRLTIIGTGPYENTLKSLVKKYSLENYIQFLGYIENHEDVEKRLSAASLAVALYNPEKDMFTYYADPMKVKTYLSCGLPVLITDIPAIAREAEKAECAIVVDYTIEDVTRKIEYFFKDKKKVLEYRKNALHFTGEYDWNKIFENALRQV